MIIITGASDGLGLQVAKLYKKENKKVVNISRHESEYADINIITDLRNNTEIEKAVQQVLSIEEPLDALINCAGVLSIQSLEKISEDEIERVLATNVKAIILLTSNLIERIRKDGTDIVNVASSIGFKGYKDQAVYGVSKWAVRGFSKNLQEELKGTPSRVISFCPGGFKTKLFEKATGIDNTNDSSEWMRAEDVAVALKNTLDLPKNMEVTEILINRK